MVVYPSLEIAHGGWDHHSSCMGIDNRSEFLFVQVGLDGSIFGVAESNLIWLCLVTILISLLFMNLLIRQISS